MGYYQGNDGQWKDVVNKPTVKEEVLRQRKRDIELLIKGEEFINNDDYAGFRDFINTFTEDRDDWFYGLVWVRKYFATIHPDKFIQFYGDSHVNAIGELSGLGQIGSKDRVDWYQKMAHIASIAEPLGLTTYALSKVLWECFKRGKSGHNISEKEGSMKNTTNQSLNTILYGPPGTGKTWNAINVYAKKLLESQSEQEVSAEEILSESIKSLTWWQIILLALNHQNQPMRVTEIVNTQIVQAYSKYVKQRTSNVAATIWSTLQERSTLDSSNTMYRAVGAEYFVKNEKSEWSLSPDGKAYANDSLGDIPTSAQPVKGRDWKRFLRVVTFHQSYSYEEFVEGIRPDLDSETGKLSYRVQPGVFKQIAAMAQNDPSNNYLLVIDEINRGNIAKIFGELITLLEDDKRGKMSVILPYSQEEFTVPANLYVLGTMNTADRSIALLDIALRRRFNFEELMPDYSLIDYSINGLHLGNLLRLINQKISVLIDQDHQIGHSYFMRLESAQDLHKVWYKKILPLLQEYFYNDWGRLQQLLGRSLISEESVVFSSDFDLDDSNLYSFKQLDSDNLINELQNLIDNEETADSNVI